jgi:hypothetical protein
MTSVAVLLETRKGPRQRSDARIVAAHMTLMKAAAT